MAISSVVACSSDGDDSASTAGSGGTTATGGGHSAGAAGAHSAGAGQGGGSVDVAGAGNDAAGSAGEPGAAGDTGDAGAAGAGTIIVPPTPPQAGVYTMSNAADANQVFGFLRAADGSLSPMAAPFATLGKGSAAGLGEQGALAIDLAQKRIYAVNAGDNSFSVFALKDDGSLGTAVNVTTAAFGATAATLLGPKSITFHG
ncbi:MAG TPA: hypothetical protein VGL19_03635, partial [Polyangiaceae bacterium]